ncbi:MAG: hypothetical protein WCB04_15010, partial [Mycobacteriales bacterium]
MTSRHMRTLVAACASLILLSACGSHGAGAGSRSGPAPHAGKTHTMSDGRTMTDAEMKKMSSSGQQSQGHSGSQTVSAPGSVTHRQDGPSQPAGMICSLEVAQAVQRTFALPSLPNATDAWSNHSYTCTYRLPTSTLRLSVQDLAETT